MIIVEYILIIIVLVLYLLKIHLGIIGYPMIVIGVIFFVGRTIFSQLLIGWVIHILMIFLGLKLL